MKKRIVIVIDNSDLRDILGEILKYSGFDVKELSGIENIFAVLTEFEPHLVILDNMLRGKTGAEICKKIRASELFAGLKVAMVSLYPTEFDKNGCCAPCLTKPFSLDALLGTINQLIESIDVGAAETNYVLPASKRSSFPFDIS